MTRPGRVGWLALLLILGAALAACGARATLQGSDVPLAALATVGPEAAATLTAWPTPPPAITRAPTPTAAPRPLWTPVVPQPATTAPAGITPERGTANGQALPPGAGSRAVRLLIPALDLDAPVIEVAWIPVFDGSEWRSEWETAADAAGHHRDSANPGEAGNVVMSGHHNTRGEVFRALSEIGTAGSAFGSGDPIIVEDETGRLFTYTVVQWERLDETGATPDQLALNTRFLEPTADATLTLITCWPYEGNSHRVVVTARLSR